MLADHSNSHAHALYSCGPIQHATRSQPWPLAVYCLPEHGCRYMATRELELRLWLLFLLHNFPAWVLLGPRCCKCSSLQACHPMPLPVPQGLLVLPAGVQCKPHTVRSTAATSGLCCAMLKAWLVAVMVVCSCTVWLLGQLASATVCSTIVQAAEAYRRVHTNMPKFICAGPTPPALDVWVGAAAALHAGTAGQPQGRQYQVCAKNSRP